MIVRLQQLLGPWIALAVGLVPPLARAQNATEGPSNWSSTTYALVPGDASIPQEPSAHTQVGPFGFDFFCHEFGGSSESLLLAITPSADLGGRWRQTFLAGGFDGLTRVSAGEMPVGEVTSFTESASGRVFVRLPPGSYDLNALVSGQMLNLEFQGASGQGDFGLRVDGAGLGPALCPVVSACGRDVRTACGVFTTIEGLASSAVPIGDTLDSDGNPRWFKSEFQPEGAPFPHYRTATAVDPEAGLELHVSCLAREGRQLGLTFMTRNEDSSPFALDQSGELVWQSGPSAGRWTDFEVSPQGRGLIRNGIKSDLMLRAALEVLMNTDQEIRVVGRQGDEEVEAIFSSAGSRDAICPVLKGCSIPLSLSPACEGR